MATLLMCNTDILLSFACFEIILTCMIISFENLNLNFNHVITSSTLMTTKIIFISKIRMENKIKKIKEDIETPFYL